MPRVDGLSFWFPKAPHRISETLAHAFAKGCRANGLEWFAEPWGAFDGGLAKINTGYGILHGGTELIRKCAEKGERHLYLDHGYIGRGTYWRVVPGELQHTSFAGGEPHVTTIGRERLKRTGIELADFKEPDPDGTIVLIPPTEHQYAFYGPSMLSPAAWTEAWKAHCEKKFALPVVVSRKGDEIPLTKLLDRASYVVGFNSSGLFEAAARGIRVESTGPSPLFWLKPWYGREQLEETRLAIFCEIACRQFTVEEFGSGSAWRILAAIGDVRCDR